jgi:hypothetical protein
LKTGRVDWPHVQPADTVRNAGENDGLAVWRNRREVTERAANALRSLGINPGQRVG